ncbi:Plasmodium exported protein, unknown function [Plasmodium knowlesi strain H]|uniref:Pv-fam-d protein n=3 Tax=Plasmodium knowlesi TaxID=5850 RepID=A0A5K1VGP0_PLAKH|nr:Plasmodium exported protein, unknown function [Plasmodium knowlesi strain H]OTN66425.1 Uncharacterized protein PKNOH_S09509800 [Plasmodium knowlesi]CAA9986271.1 Plasmodium exported protein, unknown function [Plasmodium knowlesi strain H]SBO25483.1 Plasmodium exported protein, unknown function [Plasmodium knowlesi strain H]SBO28259.1 Plasmodium exported protein, unknown function [Plasmodium knowlesi strain H]VVS75745.1 Plasmodium exported protein, unknown function [Plasmodium knowlesi strain|eukprot:XP_002257679.1 hypothetical protein, conserved in Plasmodium species [Plasmodium knowlesi strain H]
MGETSNRFLFLFVKIFTLSLFIWTWKCSYKPLLDSSILKKRSENGGALSGRRNRLLSKNFIAKRTDEAKIKKLKERVIKILKEDESSLGKMLNNLVHDANFQKEFSALLRDKGFEKQFNELVSDTNSEGNQSLSLHSLSTYDGGDITPIDSADHPEPPNSVAGSQVPETNFSFESYHRNFRRRFFPSTPTPEITQVTETPGTANIAETTGTANIAETTGTGEFTESPNTAETTLGLCEESSKTGSVEQLIHEIRKSNNLEKMIQILKFYENIEDLVKLAEKTTTSEQVPPNSEIGMQEKPALESLTEVEIDSHLQAQLQEQLQAKLQAQMQTQVNGRNLSRKRKSKIKFIFGDIYRIAKSLDKKFENHLLKVLTTNYSFLIKNGKISRLRYYLDVLLSVSPLIFGGIILCLCIDNFSLLLFIPSVVFAAIILLYFLFKLWNCKCMIRGSGRFNFNQKYKAVIEVLKN